MRRSMKLIVGGWDGGRRRPCPSESPTDVRSHPLLQVVGKTIEALDVVHRP